MTINWNEINARDMKTQEFSICSCPSKQQGVHPLNINTTGSLTYVLTLTSSGLKTGLTGSNKELNLISTKTTSRDGECVYTKHLFTTNLFICSSDMKVR